MLLTTLNSNLDRNPVLQYNYDAFFGIHNPIMYVKVALSLLFGLNSSHTNTHYLPILFPGIPITACKCLLRFVGFSYNCNDSTGGDPNSHNMDVWGSQQSMSGFDGPLASFSWNRKSFVAYMQLMKYIPTLLNC